MIHRSSIPLVYGIGLVSHQIDGLVGGAGKIEYKLT